MLSWLERHALPESRVAASLKHFLWMSSVLDTFAFPAAADINDSAAHEGAVSTPVLMPYGSFVTGMSFRDGDIDYAVCSADCLDNVSRGSSEWRAERRERHIDVLNALKKHCMHRAGLSLASGVTLRADIISGARLPILQCCSCSPAVAGTSEMQKFDLSSTVTGVLNSLFLRDYVVTGGGRLWAGLLLVKMWGRLESITNAYRGLLSPYALTIMYIHFMRTTKRMSVFIDEQNLSRLHVYRVMLERFRTATHMALGSSGADGMHNDKEEDSSEAACLNYFLCPARSLSLYDGPSMESSVTDDVRSFFRFYSDEALFDLDEDVIDVRSRDVFTRRSQWLERCREMDARQRWNLLGHEVILIRDPFEEHNLARSVDFFKAEAIRDAFRNAAKAEDLTKRVMHTTQQLDCTANSH